MISETHYLKKELYDLIQKDPSIFEFIQNGSLDGLWYWDLENPENEWMSPRFWTTLGYNPEDKKHVASEWQGVIHPQDLQTALENFRKHFADPDYPYDQVVRYRHKEGSTAWIRCRGIAIRDKTGKPIRMLGAHTDLTSEKRSEEALRQSEARWRSFIELTDQLVWTTNSDGEVVDDIPSWRSFTGQSEEEIKGWGWSKALHPDDLKNTKRVWKKSIREKNKYEGEYRLRGFDGTYRHFLARGVPILKDNGQVQEWVGTCIDITERKEMETALRKSHEELETLVRIRTAEIEEANAELIKYNRQLEELNKELQDFVSIASHDLREPLRKVQTFGELITNKSGASLDETSRDYLERMVNATKRMQVLIDSLLAYSRVTTQTEQLQDIDLRKAVDTALSNLEIIIKERNALIEVEDLPSIKADLVHMIQLFQNLIGNALKFQREGATPHVKIYARPVNKNRAYEIYVEDNGIGFEPRYLDRIFIPFHRLHGRSSYDGAGIGLAICQKIVERHGGRITAQSEMGKGSTFIVTLPLNRKVRLGRKN